MEIYLFLLLLSFATLLPLSFSSPSANDKYDTCAKNLTCGDVEDISYPFYYGSIRPEYCGHPGFELNCSTTPPTIKISNIEYFFKGMGNKADSIKVSRADSWTTPCPDSLTNTTIDYSMFNFTSADQNITYFYDCSQSILYFSIAPADCDSDDSGSLPGYYLNQTMVLAHSELFQICTSHIDIPIRLLGAYTNLPLQALVDAFKAGFELSVIADNQRCNNCSRSGGKCGYDWEANKFACHCSDADYGQICKVYNSPAQAPQASKDRTKVGVIIGASIIAFLLLLGLGGGLVWFRRRRSQYIAQNKSRGIFATPDSLKDNGGPRASNPGSNGLTSSQGYTTSSTYSQSNASYMSSQSEIGRSHLGVHLFEYTELEHATNYFDESKELGDGGFGTVYYGVLPDGRQVAVKKLYENSLKRVGQFMNEIKILAEIKHKNLVTLYGHTSKKSRELLLVYEYIANGTVADHLHGKLSETSFLRWPNRLNIAVETAEALAFLHRNDVIHRDVKTTNILLDESFHVKVADFGLSRLFPTDMTHVSTAPQGTPGYVDPEYYQCYRLTEKSDVYSFGVVLIELISSKHAVDITRHRHDVNLASMAVDRIQNCAMHELVDPRLDFDKDRAVESMVKMVAELGFQCLQQDRDMRPTMDEVLVRLKAVQSEGFKDQKQEVIVYADDVGLLTNPTPPLSPELRRSDDAV